MSWIVIRGRLRRGYRHIANKRRPNRALSGEPVAKVPAEKVFGWKNVHNHEGTPTFTRQLDQAKVIMPRKKTPVRVLILSDLSESAKRGMAPPPNDSQQELEREIE
jgi:hypothetical protein